VKIARISATPLAVPARVQLFGLDRTITLSVCLVEIETGEGLIGHGLTAIADHRVVAAMIREVVAPALTGEDALAHERLWERMYWLLSPRGQTGFASHAMAAVDIALWDLKGKKLGQPLWRLLGGARDKVPVYATFGLAVYDRAQLVEAAKLWVSQGHRRLKMVVADQALKRRDTPRPLAEVILEDAARVRAVREAVGPGIELYIDANCCLDQYHALRLARMVEECDISFFEEPLTHNDVRLMADMRRQTRIPLAAGQHEGLAFRFRDMLVANAVDVVQPNVIASGGYTQCLRIAGLAAAFNVPIANGGAWTHHNMHLLGGLANGTLVEYNYVDTLCCEQLFPGLEKPADGWLTLPQAPGLGFEPDAARVRELARRDGRH